MGCETPALLGPRWSRHSTRHNKGAAGRDSWQLSDSYYSLYAPVGRNRRTSQAPGLAVQSAASILAQGRGETNF